MTNNTYTFNNYSELEQLIKTEMKLAKRYLRETKNKTYKDYYYMLSDILRKYNDSPVEVINEIRIDSLKDYALDMKAKKHSNLCMVGWAFRGISVLEKEFKEKFHTEQFLEEYRSKFKEIFQEGQTQLQE